MHYGLGPLLWPGGSSCPTFYSEPGLTFEVEEWHAVKLGAAAQRLCPLPCWVD
jgi:hypothetical protein